MYSEGIEGIERRALQQQLAGEVVAQACLISREEASWFGAVRVEVSREEGWRCATASG
jgi:hypothetical protein